MTMETARAFFTYLTALVVVVGGILVIYLTRDDASASELRVIMAGFVGAALQFLFGSQISTQTTGQNTTAATVGAQAALSTTPQQVHDVNEPPKPSA